jgi:nucleotide-binding universal stress UspA family protein
MFMNVLVGVDGTANGRDAIALASRLTDPKGAMTLANVRPGPLRPLHAVTPGLVEEERDASMRMLRDERAAASVDAELESVVAMTPGHGLHVRAEGQGADLLVVGSCGRGVIGRAMIGDDTRAALNGAPCAIAVASRGYAERPNVPARIGVAYDASQESKAALAVARELAAQTGATVRALQVVSPPTYAFTGLVPTEMASTLDVVLEKTRTMMEELPGVEGEAIYGLPGQLLASFSDEVDLLIVGSRSYGPWRRLVLGSTSRYLARHARCSLLVVPRSAAPLGEDGEGGPEAHSKSRSMSLA